MAVRMHETTRRVQCQVPVAMKSIDAILDAAQDLPRPYPLRMSRDLNGMYDGGHLFLLLSGPSLADIDPLLFTRPGIVSMAVNNAAAVIRPSHFWIGCDDPSRFLLSVFTDPRIVKFVPEQRAHQRLFDSAQWEPSDLTPATCGPLVTFSFGAGWKASEFLNGPHVHWGDGQARLTMTAAIRIACALGFSRIVLVGCDWHMSSDQPYAFNETRTDRLACRNNGYYRTWSERFAELRPILECAGVEVLNATPGSHLQAFDVIDLADAIADAHDLLIVQPTQEQTCGMYTPTSARQLT